MSASSRFAGLAILLPAVLAAAPGLAAPGDVTRQQMQAEVSQVFDLADTNKDGFMSKAEFGARMSAVLNRTPPGTRGAPTKAEAQRMLEAANAAFVAVDTNGDGKLSRAEAMKRPLAAFDAMDANHDGILTVAEKAAARAAGNHPIPAAPTKGPAKK